MAKKRYHHKARHREHMEAHPQPHHSPTPSVVSEKMHEKAYSGKHESRRMIARDGAMIAEDRNAPCLLPQRVIESYWPKPSYDHMGYVDDLFYGVQKQMHEDYDDMDKELDPKKY